MRTRVIANDILLDDVSRSLALGQKVILRTKGRSMLPFIVGGRDSVELIKVQAPLRVLDIVLARVESSNEYVIHRVVGLDGEQVRLMGDGNIKGREICHRTSVVALVNCVIRGHKTINPNSNCNRLLARIWVVLLPIRRYILAFRKLISFFF